MSKRWVGVILLLSTILWAQGFTWSSISSPKKVGVKFTVTITSDDPNFNKTANLYMIVNGNYEEYVRPKAVTFSNGKWEGSIMVTYAHSDVQLSCVYGNKHGESNSFDVEVGTPKRVQVLAPGENSAPGTDEGKTGSAEVIAGGKYNYTINICDTFWNQVTEVKEVTITTTDPFGKTPGTISVSGTGTAEITLRTAPNKVSYQNVIVSASGMLSDTSRVHVSPAPYRYLLIIAPGETHVPGDTSIGKQGQYETPQVGYPYYVQVLAIDSCYNRIWSAPEDQITIIEINDGEIGEPKSLTQGAVDSLKVMFKHKGTNTIWAKDINEPSIVGKAFDFIVATGVAEIIPVVTPAEVPVGTPATIEATAYDDQHNPVPFVDVNFNIIQGDTSVAHVDPPSAKTDAEGKARSTFIAEKEGTYVVEVSSGGAKSQVTIVVKGGAKITVWPNPYRPEYGNYINIKYPVEVKANQVVVVITDVFGNLVLKQEFTDPEHTDPGFPIFQWDGKNAKGVNVAHGLYQISIRVNRQDGVVDNFRGKIIIIR